jgi:acetate kinase
MKTTITQESLVLALNAGSSSLKASILKGEEMILSFLAERLTTADAVVNVNENGTKKRLGGQASTEIVDHAKALSLIIGHLETKGMLANLVAVGHRVVHGGSTFTDSVLLTDETVDQISAVSHLAPLHNPHNLAGIHVMRQLLKDVPNAAVFDTSFHSTIPEKAYTYPIPAEYRARDMRKFGFHGTSVKYVSEQATQLLIKTNPDKTTNLQMIVCHLGNGASITAVSDGKSKETSMGFTPLSGLMMGTRCGSVDPSLVGFACDVLGKSVDEVLTDFNKRSGLKGMTKDGENDMRELLARANKSNNGNDDDGDCADAQLAIEMFVYRLAQHIASSLVALDGPLDAIVFTAGIGEHSAEIRRRTIQQLANVLPTITLDEKRNEMDGKETQGILSMEGSWPLVLDIPTDEEAMIAKECHRLLAEAKRE